VRSRVGAGYLLDLAGAAPIEDWPSWAKALLGSRGEWLDYQDTARGLYRAAVLRAGRVTACLFVGEAPAAAAVEPMLGCSEVDLRSVLAGTTAATDPGALVCACFGVGRRVIEGVIADGSARCTVSLGRLLKAGTNCGSCLPELEVLLATHAAAPLSSTTPPG
jgi:assimilatory nitrate reductase catalytic subunit